MRRMRRNEMERKRFDAKQTDGGYDNNNEI